MSLLSNYTETQTSALELLFEAAVRIWDTGGGSTCVKVLLGLYNGQRFPFDLTDLRRMDDRLLNAALHVIHMDAYRTPAEIHVVLAELYGVDRQDISSIFENWGWDLGLKGRCKKEYRPQRVSVELKGAF